MFFKFYLESFIEYNAVFAIVYKPEFPKIIFIITSFVDFKKLSLLLLDIGHLLITIYLIFCYFTVLSPLLETLFLELNYFNKFYLS